MPLPGGRQLPVTASLSSALRGAEGEEERKKIKNGSRVQLMPGGSSRKTRRDANTFSGSRVALLYVLGSRQAGVWNALGLERRKRRC